MGLLAGASPPKGVPWGLAGSSKGCPLWVAPRANHLPGWDHLQAYEPLPSVFPDPSPDGTPSWGEYSLGEARRGLAPPNLGFILASFTSKFADVLGLVG